MPAKFTPAPEVENIARDLIEKFHPHLLAHAVRIEYVFRDDVPSRNGKDVWGTCRKITSLNAFLAGEEDAQEDGETPPFFVITISYPIWKRLKLEQKKALIDHELCHAWAEEHDHNNTVLKLVGHDLEEFNAVVQRYGLWRDDVKAMAQSIEGAQIRLPLGEAA